MEKHSRWPSLLFLSSASALSFGSLVPRVSRALSRLAHHQPTARFPSAPTNNFLGLPRSYSPKYYSLRYEVGSDEIESCMACSEANASTEITLSYALRKDTSSKGSGMSETSAVTPALALCPRICQRNQLLEASFFRTSHPWLH